MTHPAIAVVAAAAGAAVGARLAWLTWRGAGAAAGVGAVTLAGAGWRGAILLILFFVSGSALTRARRKRTEPRRARQVLANGGWAAVGAVLIPTAPLIGWCSYTGALAAAQADTWASEIGMRYRPAARRITTGEPVPAGRSGGVTGLGTVAGVVGASIMAGAGVLMGAPLTAGPVALAAGVGGMLVDSLLGDTLQGDEPGLSGPAWFSNDLVNLIATGTAAAAAAGMAWGSVNLT